MADTMLQQLAKTDRNPIQEEQYQGLLRQAGIPFTVVGGKTNVTGFGVGGNTVSDVSGFAPGGTLQTSGTTQSFIDQQAAAQQALLAGQQAKESDFLTRFSGAISGFGKPQDIYSQLSTQLGIDPLRQAATSLEQTVAGLPDVTTQRAQQFGLSQGQQQQLLASQQQKMAPALTSAETALGARTGELTTLLGATQASQQQQLLPFQTEAGFISDAAARATSLFTQQNQNEFNLLLNKIQNDQSMTAKEADQANALALKAQDYNNQLALYKQYPQLTQSGSRYIKMSNGIIYDTYTGQTVSEGATGGGGGANPDIGSIGAWK